MKKYLLTYSGRGSTDIMPRNTDRSFDTIEEIERYIVANDYDVSYDYHVWELCGGFTITKNVVATKTPPMLT